MAANRGINLFDLLTPGHVDDIVRNIDALSYEMLYNLSAMTREALLDNLRLKKMSSFTLVKFPVTDQKSLARFDLYDNSLYISSTSTVTRLL